MRAIGSGAALWVGLAMTACGGSSSSDGSSGGAAGAAATGGSAGGGAGGASTGGAGGASTGGASTGGAGGASTGGAAGAAGTGMGGSGGDYVDCPPAPPGRGDPCMSDGLSCSWGDDPRFDCRTTGNCGGGQWNINPPAGDCTDPPRPPTCPDAPPQTGADCMGPPRCVYDDGTSCLCTNCPPGEPVCMGGQTRWSCTPPPGDNCPSVPPNEGTRCDREGQQCNYTCRLQATCTNGAWSWIRDNCPVCAAPDTPIATPGGDRAIADLRVGDLVYSVEEGAVRAVPVLRIGQTRVRSHRVVEVTLDDGGVLEISPGHPTADGRFFGDLKEGDSLGAKRVTGVRTVPFVHEHTHDILPASSSGSYFAGGALVGSTLAAGRCSSADRVCR